MNQTFLKNFLFRLAHKEYETTENDFLKIITEIRHIFNSIENLTNATSLPKKR